MPDDTAILIETDEHGPASAAEIAGAAAVAGLDVRLCAPADISSCVREAVAAGGSPSAVLIGSQLRDPVAVAREVYRLLPQVQIVFLTAGDRDAELRRRLALAPRIGTNWSLAAPAGETLARALEAASRSTRQRRQHRTTLDRVRLSLAAPPPADAPDYRRLVLSDRYLGSILAHAREAIFSTDLSGTVRSWNRGAEQTLGYSENEVLGRPLAVLGGEAPDSLLGLVRAVTEGAAEIRREMLLRRSDGASVAVEMSLAPVRDEQGTLLGVSVIARDVTDRRRAEAALREQEEWLRVTLRSIGDAVIATDTETRVRFLNPVAERLTGWTGRDAEGRPVTEVFRIVNEETRRTVENPIDRAMRDGVIVGLANHTVLIARDGAERPIDDSAAPIHDSDGRVRGGVLVFRDVSERKRAERQTRFLAEAGTLLSTLVDFQSTLQKVARLAVPFFADICLVDLVGEDGRVAPVAHAHADPDKEELLRRFQAEYPLDWDKSGSAIRVLQSGKGDFFAEVTDELMRRVTWDEGQLALLRELRPISFLAVPLQVRGRTLGVMRFATAGSGYRYTLDDLAFAEEIARRAAAAIENSSLYREVRDADRRKDEFLAMLAHELRNPLAPIRSGLDLLRMAGSEPEVVDAMGQQVEHLVRLVDDLLDVSRIIRGKVELRKEEVELKTIVTRAVETSQPLIYRHGHELSVALPSEEVWLEADPVRLSQVVANLLNNAAKYTENGGRIGLSAARDGGGVVLVVQDTGVGIEPELLPKVFDLFTQSDRTIERSQGGLGIGLTLVKSLVELHGGTVDVKSEGLGRGSEFVVRLPILIRTRPSAAPAWMPARTRPLRVLLVEDMVASAKMLSALLTRFWQHEVLMVHDGIAALEAARELRPELVLLDVGLPGMTGYEVAERLRQLPSGDEMLLVALTGYGQPEDRRRTAEAGFDEHLVKPASVESLQALFAHPKLIREK